MKSIAPFFLISLITCLTTILCSCGEPPQIHRPLLKLSGPVKNATLTVTGIVCDYCNKKIEVALLSIPGVKNVSVNSEAQDNVKLSYYTDHVDMEKIKSVLESIGHGVSFVKVK